MKYFNVKQVGKKLGADRVLHETDWPEDVLYFDNDDGITEIYTIMHGEKILYSIANKIHKPEGFITPYIEINMPIELFINTFQRKRYMKTSFWRMGERQLRKEHDKYRKSLKAKDIDKDVEYYTYMVEAGIRIADFLDIYQSVIMLTDK